MSAMAVVSVMVTVAVPVGARAAVATLLAVVLALGEAATAALVHTAVRVQAAMLATARAVVDWLRTGPHSRRSPFQGRTH